MANSNHLVFRSNCFIFDTNFGLTGLNVALLLNFLLYCHLLLLRVYILLAYFFAFLMLPAHLSDISSRKRYVQWEVFPQHEMDWGSIFWM